MVHTGDLLDKGNQDETNEGIADASFHNVVNLLHKRNGDQRDASKRDGESNEDFGQCKLRLSKLLMAIVVFVLIRLINLVEETIVRNRLVVNVDQISHE